MSSHYESTPQKENVAAAINWHSQFPREQLVPYENVMFQKGKKIDESEFRSEDGQPWEEVGYLMHGFQISDYLLKKGL